MGADDDDERAALERELAAQLASLDDKGEDDEDVVEEECRYERLDLDAVLQQVATAETDAAGTWTQLVASVAYCDAHVFQVFQSEMDALATDVLPALAAVAKSVQIERGIGREEATTAALKDDDEVAQGDSRDEVAETADMKPVETQDELKTPVLATEEVQNRFQTSDNAILAPPEPLAFSYPVAAPTQQPGTPQAPSQWSSTAVETPKEPSPPLIQEQEPLKAPAVVVSPGSPMTSEATHATRRQRVHQTAHEELDAWFASKTQALADAQAAQRAHQRQVAFERMAREAMAREDRAMQAFLTQERMARETEEMTREDAASQAIEAALALETHQQQRERQLLAHEETRMWRVLRFERETQRKERLVEAVSRIRRSHHRVMSDLVETLALRAEAQRKREGAERRRAAREASDMRNEELVMRRVLVHERMAREGERRQQERSAMENEDEGARTMRENERQQRIQQETQWMAAEDARSRAYETLRRLRLKRLQRWISGQSKRSVRRRWSDWKRLVVEQRQREHDQQRETAARVIQSMAKHWLQRREHTAADAARVVQSAFRGFYVRRKFQNALDVAQRMALDEDEFDEVNLDDLITTPPELEDDWETPVTIPQRIQVEPAMDSDDEDKGEQEHEDEGGEELVRDEGIEPVAMRLRTPQRPRPQPVAPEATGGNLAAVLWNKMRQRKHKQQLALAERQKEQDPVYRVQKLLKKPAPTSLNTTAGANNNNQQPPPPSTVSSIQWATNTDKKKAPKVKLPSLVERLRKKTAAAR